MINKTVAVFLALFLLLAVGLAKDPPQITDDTLTDAVRVKLAGDQLVGVVALQVAVKDGVVTLSGAVDQKGYKSKAEKIAKSIKGVKKVVNNIEVKPRP